MEKLLDGVTVELKPLQKVGKIIRGSAITEKETKPGKYPVVGNGPSHNYFHNQSNRNGETIVIARSGAYAGLVSYWDVPIFLTDAFSIHPDLDILKTKFLFYLLKNDQTMIHNMTKGAGVPHVRATDFESYQIPIPCPDNPQKSLQIQAEIVRILDTFTELAAELTAELTARKKQYSYYRDKLLTFEEGEVEWKTLGEVGEFTYGFIAKAQDSGDARFVRITDINTNGKLVQTDPKFVDITDESKKYILEKNDLLMARTGATFGKTMIFEENYPAIFAGFLIKLDLDRKTINPKYYWHFAQSEFFWHQANKLVSGGGQPQFNANVLRDVKFPIPFPDDPQKSLAEQARIVDILDKFDALTSSITEGLPREIELRRKQYEYYRNLLLTFPKKN
jgi:type I restriction enzyme S subunit